MSMIEYERRQRELGVSESAAVDRVVASAVARAVADVEGVSDQPFVVHLTVNVAVAIGGGATATVRNDDGPG